MTAAKKAAKAVVKKTSGKKPPAAKKAAKKAVAKKTSGKKRPAAKKAVKSKTNNPQAGVQELDLVEIETEDVDEYGNVVVDDIVALVDDEGNIIAIDETITALTPNDEVIVNETVSLVGDDGELHATVEDVTVLEI